VGSKSSLHSKEEKKPGMGGVWDGAGPGPCQQQIYTFRDLVRDPCFKLLSILILAFG
jgi:hypothetical protein